MKLYHVVWAVACLGSPLCAAPLTYSGSLLGSSEFPAVVSDGIGFARVTIDTTAHTLAVEADFSNLTGTTTAAHIHCCVLLPPGNAGVATQTPSFSGFPLGVTSGSFSNTFDLTLGGSFNPAFVAANGGTLASAEAALAAGLAAGQAYFNVHTTFRPGGEIRADLVLVPEPGTFTLTAAAGLLLFVAKRFRRV